MALSCAKREQEALGYSPKLLPRLVPCYANFAPRLKRHHYSHVTKTCMHILAREQRDLEPRFHALAVKYMIPGTGQLHAPVIEQQKRLLTDGTRPQLVSGAEK